MKAPNWMARPGVVLSAIAALVLVTVLFIKTPETGRGGDPRLSSTSADPLGAKLFYELSGKMGYGVSRATRWALPRAPNTIVAVLNPVVPLNAFEVHDMLNHARSGGALLVVLGGRTKAFSDSVGISYTPGGGSLRDDPDKKWCGGGIAGIVRSGLWAGQPTLFGLKFADTLRARVQTFMYINEPARIGAGDPLAVPAMVGMNFGRGRIVIASDPDVFANDALRNCNYGLDLYAVAALRYLTESNESDRTRLVFDEYHQRFRIGASSMGVVREYLTKTRSGNTILQICIAGLVLLLAASPRILPPRHQPVVERRSPLEHVDALARAYAQVGATRTGTQRLVRGLQRRVGSPRRASTRIDDDAFLSRVAESLPKSGDDVAIVRKALGQSVSSKEFAEVGNAISRIETALTRT